MRIITRKRLEAAAKQHAKVASTIRHWHGVAAKARWTNLTETRQTFSHADQVTVSSGKTVTVFNLTNHCRLITAIHYNTQKIFILRILSHAEYSRDKWKETL